MSNNLAGGNAEKLSEYLLFINSLDLKTNMIEIVDIQEHAPDCLAGWTGIRSIIASSDRQEIYEIDIRLAWSSQIFKQHLYDYGWNQSILLGGNDRQQQPRHKLIIYLCNPTTSLVDSRQYHTVADDFKIGSYWRSISHLYLRLPCQHPFELPDLPAVSISKYSNLDIHPPLSTVTNSQKSLKEGGLRTKNITRNSTINRPLISVITVVFNGEVKLAQTIQSVINQNCDNFEYIIIDGGSTDKTVDIIHQYEDQIDYWISESDMGIYDAMNKGIEIATGQWLNFMNCGDLFYNHQSLNQIPLKPDVDFYYSDAILYDSQGSIELWTCSQARKLLIHQSIVYAKNLHSTYKYLVHPTLTVSDYFFFRKNDAKNWVKLDIPLAIYNTEGSSGGGSKSFIQKLFVNFMSGDISEFQMSLLIMAKIVRSPLRMIRVMLLKLGILSSARRF
jgi:hypothetical protein